MSDPTLGHERTATFAAMSQVEDPAVLITLLSSALQTLTDAQALQVIRFIEGSLHIVISTKPLPYPSLSEQQTLALGQIVHQHDVVHLPMVVLNELRGWVTLQDPQILDEAPALVTHAASVLLLLEQQDEPVTLDQERSALAEVGRILSSTLQLDQVLAEIASVVQSLMMAPMFFIALIDQATNEFAFAYLSEPSSAPLPNQRWSVDQGLTGYVGRTGKPILTDDYQAECRRRGIEPYLIPGLRLGYAWLSVPLRHHDRILGVMVATSDDPNVRYTQGDLQLLSSVAAQAAAAVANAQLYQRVEQQARQLATINHIDRVMSATLDPQRIPMLMLQELSTALDVETGAVLLVDPETGDYVVRYALGAEAGAVVGRRLPAAIAAHDETFSCVTIRSLTECDPHLRDLLDHSLHERQCWLLCAPLAGQRIDGVVVLLRTARFTDGDAQLLHAVAEQASIVLANAAAHADVTTALAEHIDDLQQRNRQLTQLVQIGGALRSTGDLDELSNQIVLTVHQLTGSPRVLLLLAGFERRQMRAAAQFGLDQNTVMPQREVSVPFDAGQALLEQARPLSAALYHLGPHPAAPAFENSMLLMLLNQHNEIVGLIVFDQEPAQLPSTAVVQTLEVLANQAAIALDNARLVSEQRQTVDRLMVLNAFSLSATTAQLSWDELARMMVNSAVGTTDAYGGGTWLLDGDGRIKQQVIGLPATCGDLLFPLLDSPVEDYVEIDAQQLDPTLSAIGVRRVLAVPLRGAQLFLGGLWIAYRTAEIAPTDRETVVLYAKTAGAVLENMRLLDQVRTAYAHLASILASTVEGILLTTPSRVIVANAALTGLLGLPSDQLEGVSFDELRRRMSSTDAALAALVDAVQQVIAGGSVQIEGELELKLPTQRYIAWSVLSAHGDPEPRTALLVVRDITADRQTAKMRQDLTHMIVHDLRAPLTNIIASVDLLVRPSSGSLTAMQQRMVQIVTNSSHQMLELINALIDVQRLEQSQLELYQQPARLSELVAGVLEQLEQIAEERQIQLQNMTKTDLLIQVDVGLMQRVIQNLVDNAIKFSPYGSTVVIRSLLPTADMLPVAHPPGGWALVEVIDQGPGVPEEYRELVFELFGQAPQGRGRGSGIGLAFCKLTVQAHGGAIWVDDNPDGGAVFHFSVPYVKRET